MHRAFPKAAGLGRNHLMRFSKPVWCLFFLAVALPAMAAPSADEIISRVVAQDKLLVQRRKAFDYDLDIIREKLDTNKAVTQTIEEHQIVTGDHRPSYGTRSTTGTPDDEARNASREEPFELLNIIDHYTYNLEGEEVADGVLCYKIAFTPKPGMPYQNREEKVLNAVSGHLWVSTKDYSLIKNQGSLMHPVSVAWIFATLREMEFQFDSMPLPNGDAGPKQVQYRYLVSIPFTSLHERDTRKMSNYRLAATDLSGH
jgi:hypothetical protein